MPLIRQILQITGKVGAGKTSICAHLAEKYDFKVVLVSDLIREFAQSRGLELKVRADYLAVHKQMKNELGADIIAQKIIDQPHERICVDGIRVVNDVKRLQVAGAKILALDCPADIRFQRSLARRSALDRADFAAFIADDQAEARNDDPEQQATDAVMEMADYHIDASRPQAEVIKEVDAIVSAMTDPYDAGE